MQRINDYNDSVGTSLTATIKLATALSSYSLIFVHLLSSIFSYHHQHLSLGEEGVVSLQNMLTLIYYGFFTKMNTYILDVLQMCGILNVYIYFGLPWGSIGVPCTIESGLLKLDITSEHTYLWIQPSINTHLGFY